MALTSSIPDSPNEIGVVFIDDGGVLNDNHARAPQWRRLLGEYFVPRLGGSADVWAQASVGAFERSWARHIAHIGAAGASGGVDAWVRRDRERWLVDMCEQVGVEAPPNAGAAAVEVSRWVAERVNSEIPGASAAVGSLKSRGLVLHTATGGLSWEIEPYLRGMGIREHFDRLYGPDLVDRYKNGPHYYASLLADSGTDPTGAAVVDDGAEQREWASSLGIRSFASLFDLMTALG